MAAVYREASVREAARLPADALPRFMQETRGQLVRWLIHLRREPFNLLFALVQPVILLVFFGGALQRFGAPISPGGNYRAFILPGILALTVFGNSMAGGIPVLFDKESGFLARLITAPVTRSSILVSRFLAINLLSILQCLIMLGLAALFFGVRVASGAAGIAALLGIGLLLGFGVTIISLILAFSLTGHGDFFALLGIITLPLSFLSSAFVPLDVMPGWMHSLAVLNPMTYAIDSMRALVLGGSDLWSGGLLLRCCTALTAFDAAMLILGTSLLRRRL